MTKRQPKTIKPVPEDNQSHKAPAARLMFPSTPPRATATTKNTTSANRPNTGTWCRIRATGGAGELGPSFQGAKREPGMQITFESDSGWKSFTHPCRYRLRL